ncbi:STAS domain-containing protein [Streptomyces eurythermus]|uniref:STAS domain-containing protein n=1 Tax=Streptomyces eurythermus TaxID=42237 RepID=UPI0036D31E96
MEYETASLFHDRFPDGTIRETRYVVLGLSAAAFCDSSGLNVLLWAWRQAEEAESAMGLACVPANVRRMPARAGWTSCCGCTAPLPRPRVG